MSDAARQYHIKALEDILKLDDRQREDFIADRRHWLKFMDSLPDLTELGVSVSSDGMIWKDDGVSGLTGLQVNWSNADE